MAEIIPKKANRKTSGSSFTELAEDFTFSQRSIQDYLDCQRRFELRYLRKLRWPAVTSEPIDEYEKLTLLGTRFHQLVYRERSGMDPELLLSYTRDPILRGWFENYLTYFPRPDLTESFAEISLAGSWQKQYRMMAKYDLVYRSSGKGYRIVDWKTTRNRPGRDRWQNRVQTALYPLLFSAVGSELFPESDFFQDGLEMVYWYPEFPTQPEIFTYSREQAEEDRLKLLEILSEIASKPAAPEEFPKTENTERCRFCVYRSFCGRGKKAGILDDELAAALDEEDLNLNNIDFDEINVIKY